MGLIIGVIIVIVIILVVFMIKKSTSTSTTPAWNRYNSMNYVPDNVKSQGNSSDGNIKYMGKFNSQNDCEAACASGAWCKAYTWNDNNNATYSNQCFGMSNVGQQNPNTHRFSGRRGETDNTDTPWNRFKQGAWGFSNTLQRRLGMSGAGEHYNSKSCVGTFDCANENFISDPNVGANTQWSGYQRRISLPG